MENKGFSTILLVVAISSISMILATTASFLAIGDLEISNDYLSDKRTINLANSCLENTLRMIQEDKDLNLSEYPLFIDEGLCIINTDDYLSSKNIDIKASLGSYHKWIQVELLAGDAVEITSYKIN